MYFVIQRYVRGTLKVPRTLIKVCGVINFELSRLSLELSRLRHELSRLRHELSRLRHENALS